MKTLIKKSATVILSAILLLMIVFCAVTLLGNTKSVSAEENIEMPTNATMAAKDAGFTMIDAASVRVESKGIKFETEVTKGYYDGLVGDGNTVEFIVHAKNKDDATKYVLKKFSNVPDFSNGTTYTYRTYLNFDNIAAGEEKNAYKTNFSVDVYAKVTDALGSVTYYQAYRADEVVRTMRAVANSAYLNWKESDEFNKEDVEEYFTVGSRNETVDSYTTNEGNVIFTMPGSYADPADGATVKAYLNAKPITATYDKATDRYIVSNVAGLNGDNNLGKEDYISVFGADNKVYSTKAVKATEITESSIGKLMTATSGRYVLTADVDFSKSEINGSWMVNANGYKKTFAGTVDGNGYAIKNFSGDSFFYEMKNGATVKNIVFSNTTSINRGMLAFSSYDVNVENSVFELVGLGTTQSSLLGAQTSGTITLSDVYIKFPSSGVTNIGSRAYITAVASTKAILNNVYMSGQVTNLIVKGNFTGEVLDTNNDVAVKDTDYVMVTAANILAYERAELPNFIKKAFDAKVIDDDAINITKENIDVLLTATTGYYVLETDIDFNEAFADTWTPTSYVFKGVLNGNGHQIKGFDGVRLFYRFNGVIKNINFSDIASTGERGFLGYATVNTDVSIENSTFSFISLPSNRFSLLGFQESGMATLTNVCVEMPSSAYSGHGMLTCYWVTGLTMNNVYLIGGTGSYHSGEQNGDRTIANAKITGEPIYKTGDLDTCAYILENSSVPANIKSAAIKGVLECVTVLTEENIYEELYSATNGYFVLGDDIDMSKVNGGVWNPTVTFSGVLNGNGREINNLKTVSGGAGLFYTNMGVVKNLNIQVSNLNYNSGVFGRVGNSATLSNVNVFVDGISARNAGLFMAVQGDINIDNVNMCIKTIFQDNVSTSGFICGNSITDGKYITVADFYMYGEESVIGTALSTQLKGAGGETAVQGTDYYLFTENIGTAIASHAPDFIKNLYNQANA